MKLRDYQQDCIASVSRGLTSGNLNQLVVAATGTGKTQIFCSVKKELGLTGPVLVVAHLDFLLRQAIAAWEEINPGDVIGLEQADNKLDPEIEYDVIFASLQTVRGARLETLARIPFCLVVADEAHHTASDSYEKLFSVLGLLPERRTSKALLLGVTASPSRLDRKDLSRTFPYLAFEYDHWSALEAGWWCPVHSRRVLTNADLTKVSVIAGEFVSSDLDRSLMNDKRTKKLHEAWEAAAGDSGRTVVFCSSRAYARHLADRWPSKKTLYIDGDSEDREGILKEFQETAGAVLVNVRLIVEGVDVPTITHVVFASPVHSDVTHVQALGRGTRPSPGKDRLTVLYAVDKVGAKVKLRTPPSLLGLPSSFDLEGLELQEARKKLAVLTADSPVALRSLVESGLIPDTFLELEKALEAIIRQTGDVLGPLRGKTELCWSVNDAEALLSGETETAESFLLSIPAPYRPAPTEPKDGRTIVIRWDRDEWLCEFFGPPPEKARIQAELRELSDRYKREASPIRRSGLFRQIRTAREQEAEIPDVRLQSQRLGRDLGAAVQRVDGAIEKKLPSSLKIVRLNAPWRSEAPTDKQLGLARKIGVAVPNDVSKGDLSLLIDRKMRQRNQGNK